MLPRPATTRWSSRATLIATFLRWQARARAAASNSADSGSGPSPPSTGWSPRAPAGTRSINPKRRGSLKVIVVPDDITNITWSCLPLIRGGAAFDAEVARHAEMDQQRLARRQRRRAGTWRAGSAPSLRCPISRSPNPAGKGMRRLARRTSTAVDPRRRPSPAPASAAPVRLRAVRARPPHRTRHGRRPPTCAGPASDVLVSISDQGAAEAISRPAQPWSFRVRRLRKVSQARNRHLRGASEGRGHGTMSTATFLPVLNEVEKASIRERQPLPERYLGLSDEDDGAAHRRGAGGAGRPARHPRPSLPARRGDPVRRLHRRLVQAVARDRQAPAGRVHRVLRRALHGRERRRPRRCRTRR